MKKNRFFEFEQLWLDGLDASGLAKFICGLAAEGTKIGSVVHGIILPELSLSQDLASKVSVLLGAALPELQFFTVGYFDRTTRKNSVYTCFYRDGRVQVSKSQNKHHRWKLDDDQLWGYSLDHRFPKKCAWWEPIEYSPRAIHFYEIRDGACMTTLICEDLARLEPVHDVIRSVGANLVVCLLFDGAQRIGRWSHRYATGLADDPGCSVLTLTCFGSVRRFPDATDCSEVALWKERGQDAKPLKLDKGHHALILPLHLDQEEEFTMDSRSDGESSVKLCLTSYRQIKYSDDVPDWLDY